MNPETRAALLEKNQKIIQMVVERAKRDFPEDIALIGLTGSFRTGDYHEKSDLDLIIINNTPRGWEIADCFLLGDVGYDIYCTPWETRIEAEANLESPVVSSLTELQILYYATPRDLERFNAYRDKALGLLAQPIGKACLDRAAKHLESAKRCFADALLRDGLGEVRYAAGSVLYHLVNALISMNNTCIKRGIRRYLEELRALPHLPEGFEEHYMALVGAKTRENLRREARELLRGAESLWERLRDQTVERPVPTRENLAGTYEELWCNYRNKVLLSTELGDESYAFHAAMGAQQYLDEMRELFGTPKFDLMADFDASDLSAFRQSFLHTMDEYLEEYRRVGLSVKRFSTFEELYRHFMRRS